jgi:hypothetical protein
MAFKFKNPWEKGGTNFPDHVDDSKKKLFNKNALNTSNAINNDLNPDDGFLTDDTISKKVALAFYGGARDAGDNDAFNWSAKNTQTSYGSIYSKKLLFASTAKLVVDTINNQEEDNIGRLDILTHASATACYMVRNKDTKENGLASDIPKDKVQSNNLYASATAEFIESWFAGPDERTISSIEFSKFTKDSVVELHGCNVATTPYELVIDNLAQNISEELYSNDKTQAVVIGHAESMNPNINGDKTTKKQQDYRHKKRIIYHNGSVLFRTEIKGHIGKEVIKLYLKEKQTAADNKKTYDGNKKIYKK